MSRSGDSSIDGFLRSAFAGLVIAGIGYAGGWVFTTFCPNVLLKQAHEQLAGARDELAKANVQLTSQAMVIQQLDSDLKVSQRHIEQLNLSMSLLKVDQRVAEITVLRQDKDDAGIVRTEFAFQEVNGEGHPLDLPRTFQIVGELLYVDFWVIKFEDRFVEMADVDRSTSICLFQRLFGEFQEPHEGYTLDDVGSRPVAYGNARITEFESQLWQEFWTIAGNPQRAAELGIRAAHGQAVSTQLKLGHKYRVSLRASDGLTIVPIAPPQPIAANPNELSSIM